MVQGLYSAASPYVGIGHGCSSFRLTVHCVHVQIYVDAATGEEMPVSAQYYDIMCSVIVLAEYSVDNGETENYIFLHTTKESYYTFQMFM